MGQRHTAVVGKLNSWFDMTVEVPTVGVPHDTLKSSTVRRLEWTHTNWTPAEREEVAHQLIWADASGTHTHGVVRLRWLERNIPDCASSPETLVSRTDASACYDATGAIGYVAVERILTQWSGSTAAHLAIRNAFPTGMFSYYVRNAVREDIALVGVVTAPPSIGDPPIVGANVVLVSVSGLLFDGSLAERTVGDGLLAAAELSGSAGAIENRPKIRALLCSLQELAAAMDGSDGSRSLHLWRFPVGALAPSRRHGDTRRPGERAASRRHEALTSGLIQVPARTWAELEGGR
jgi:LDH2 family malate/lactate/ureidoglycolate dehydrogenase